MKCEAILLMGAGGSCWNARMRFSLKDLFCSVTLASAGMAAFAIAFAWPKNFGTPQTVLLMTLFMAIFISPGPCIGAAIGNLFHKTRAGAELGFLIGLAFAIGCMPFFFPPELP